MSDERPEPGTPEFEQWILERAKKRAEELYKSEVPEELAEKVGSGIMTDTVCSDDLKNEKTFSEDIKIDKEIKRSHLKVLNK